MASRMITERIPQNPRVNKGVNVTTQKRKAADAVSPSTKASTVGVKPSTIGIAAQKRFAQLAKVAAVTFGGLNVIDTIRDSAEEYPELAALANDPRLMAVIQRVVAKIGKEVDSLTRNEAAGKGPDHENDEEVLAAAREQERTGMDAARPVLTAEDAEHVERARAKLSRLRTAEGMGDAGDIIRAKSGMDERALDADDLYGLFEGKRK